MSKQVHIYIKSSWNELVECETTTYEFSGGHAEWDGDVFIGTINGTDYELPISYPVEFILTELGFDSE